jgi:DNA ligase-1
MTKLFETDESDIPNFTTLYKKTSTGAIQYWNVSVTVQYHASKKVGVIKYKYGQKDGKEQVTDDYIKNGKNIGKVNETNVIEQTILEAQAKWEKQKKKGYVESIKDAEEGKIDNTIIEGGVNPMLAHKYRDHSEKIKFECFGQPKFDGCRMVAIINNGKCTLWSRTRKPIKSLPHIQKELEKLFSDQNIILDGEAYNHEYKDKFETLISAIRKDEPHENSEIIQYHIYDLVSDESFKYRNDFLQNKLPPKNKFIKKVETILINDETEVLNYYKDCMSRGYEGCMLRNSESSYEFKRSYHLQKVKQFDDHEFNIVDVEEGSGRLRGHVGAFICEMPNGTQFRAKMSGDTKKLKEYFENHKLWKNKKLTCQFQGFTNKENVPRFPVGLRIREDE